MMRCAWMWHRVCSCQMYTLYLRMHSQLACTEGCASMDTLLLIGQEQGCRTLPLWQILPLPLFKEISLAVSCLRELTGLKGEEDWVLPSVADLRQLHWVATQSFNCSCSSCTLMMDQYPCTYPLEVLGSEVARNCGLASLSRTQLQSTMQTLSSKRGTA